MSPRITSWVLRAGWLLAAIVAWSAHERLSAVIADINETSLVLRLVVYAAVYVALAGAAVPGAVLLTTLAGPLFGV